MLLTPKNTLVNFKTMNEQNSRKIGNGIKLALIGSFVIIAIYLIVAHKVHLLANASYIFFALFILAHLFMHRGHGGHGGHGDHGNRDNNKNQQRDDKNDTVHNH